MATSEGEPRGSPPPRDGLSALRPGAFPRDPDDFNTDPRVAFSKSANAWLLRDDEGSEWTWNVADKAWFPSQDQELIRRQQQAYAMPGQSDDHDDHDKGGQPSKKRKSNDENGSSKKSRKPPQERQNTAVYVENLPKDATEREVTELFSRYGVISQEIDSGRERVKLYRDDAGNVNGDALVVYFRPESVQLAIQMLDESDFRPGEPSPQGRIKVKVADMSYKKHTAAPSAQDDGNEQAGEAKPKKQHKSHDQQKIIERTQQLNRRLADWSDEDDDPSALPQTSSRHDKVVILKHMFTLAELAADPTAVLDIQEDVRDECSKHGAVTKVVVFDKEPDGAVSVRFSDAAAARAVVAAMHGRWFGGQQVAARIASPRDKFRKSAKSDGDALLRAGRFDGFDGEIALADREAAGEDGEDAEAEE